MQQNNLNNDLLTSSLEEVFLWRAVVNQSLCDLRINSDKKRIYKVLRRKARLWLTSNSRDFKIVCEYACYDSEYIRNIAVRIIKSQSVKLKL